MNFIRASIGKSSPLVMLLLPLLALSVGCASMSLPKTMTQGSITPQLKKRSEDAAKLFEQQRDTAEFEAARARWEQQNDCQGCSEGLQKLLARNPRHREAHMLLAELFLSQENPNAAYEHAKAALDLYPNDGQVQYTMAICLDAQGKASDAVSYYERATRMDPQCEMFAAAYQMARDALHGEVNNSRGTEFDFAASADGTGSQVMAARHTKTSASVATPVAGVDPSVGTKSAEFAGYAENDPALESLRLGQAALVQGSLPTALEQFRRAITTKPDNPQIPISAAAVSLRANHPDLAVELLTPAAQQFPNSAAIHRMLGAALYRTGDYKSSQVALQQALSLDKSSALSYLLLGCTLAKLGQNESAEANFRQARTLDPRYSVVR
jgi:predicted Zn-dependent protease